MQEKISEFCGSLPSATGVYIMNGKDGSPVYIGKAKNLRSRVMSYFQSERGGDRGQIPYLVREVDSVDYLVTENESEALFLENSLVKRHKPKYNIRLKDDKTFSSLRLSVKDKFPRLSRTKKVRDDGAVYFGPFASGKFLKRTVNLVHRLFPLRDCTRSKFERHRTRPCLNYFMKLCSGPCAGKISEEEYRHLALQATSFLQGDKKKLVRMIREMMEEAVEEGRYENAAYYRDQLISLKENAEIDRFSSYKFEDTDVVGFHRDSEHYEFMVLLSRGGSVVDKVNFSVKSVHDETETLREFIGRFYFSDHYVPARILLPFEIRDRGGYSQWLTEKRGKRVYLETPTRGQKKELVNLAAKNAKESFFRKADEKTKHSSLLHSIRKSTGITRTPYTIECFDISNIQGTQIVASLVRFRNAKPERDRYRRYRITSVSGRNDDFRSMYEVVYRRSLRAEQSDWELPDLILIDGGKGQLSAAFKALCDCGIENEVDVASIAKTPGRSGIDRIYVRGRSEPCDFSSNKKGIYFLMRVRDEAHRFAISYHRGLRKDNAFASRIDGVPGIGKKRKLLLLERFGSIEKIKDATVEELSSVKSMTKKAAENVKEHLK